MRIPVYNAEETRLTPNEAGYSAQERAGRLLAELTREQATAVSEQGRTEGEEIRREAWPLAFDRFKAQEVRVQFANGGGDRSRAGRTLAGPRGSHEASRRAPHLAHVARDAVIRPLKGIQDLQTMDPEMWKQVQQTEADANNWYYGGDKGASEVGGAVGQVSEMASPLGNAAASDINAISQGVQQGVDEGNSLGNTLLGYGQTAANTVFSAAQGASQIAETTFGDIWNWLSGNQ